MMLPFLLVLAVEGMILLRDLAPSWRLLAAAIAGAAMVIQGALFTVDMYATWPARSALDFDAGEIDAISRAADLARASAVLLSSSLDQPYIQAAFTLHPAPPPSFTADSASALLAEMHMALFDPRVPPAAPGVIAVLTNDDPAPAGAERLFEEKTPRAAFALGQSPQVFVTVVVYRLR
jgi:hypothetical protein